MTEAQKEAVLKSIRKKDNLDYWNEIDWAVVELICKLAQYSYPKISCYYEEDEEDFAWDEITDSSDLEVKDEILWMADDVRDFIIGRMEKDLGAWFPCVEEQ